MKSAIRTRKFTYLTELSPLRNRGWEYGVRLGVLIKVRGVLCLTDVGAGDETLTSLRAVDSFGVGVCSILREFATFCFSCSP